MNQLISVGTLLLLTANLPLQQKVMHERGSKPLLTCDSLEAGTRYLARYKDAEVVYIDSTLLHHNTIIPTERQLLSVVPQLKIVYLLESLQEITRIQLPKHSSFRMFEKTM